MRSARGTTAAVLVIWERLRLAASYLTCLGWYRGPAPTPSQAAASLVLLPLVGAALGVVLGLVELAARTLLRIEALSCSLAVGVGVLLSRRQVLESVTALGALLRSARREQVRADIRHGAQRPLGILAVLTVTLGKYAALLALAPAQRLPALTLAEGLAGAMIVWAAWRFPYAPHEGDFGEAFARYLGPQDALFAVPLLALALGAFGPLGGAAVFFIPGVLMHLAAWRLSLTVDGLTGEVYGALHQLEGVAVLGGLAWLT